MVKLLYWQFIHHIQRLTNGPVEGSDQHHEKTCLQCFPPSMPQTVLYSQKRSFFDLGSSGIELSM